MWQLEGPTSAGTLARTSCQQKLKYCASCIGAHEVTEGLE